VFVEENTPAPVVSFAFNAPTIGPARKIIVQAALSGELETATAGTAETLVARALSEAATKGIDAVVFSADAATNAAPAGLLRNLVALSASSETGIAAAATDIGGAVAAMASAGSTVAMRSWSPRLHWR
jgi:hypothetical protein